MSRNHFPFLSNASPPLDNNYHNNPAFTDRLVSFIENLPLASIFPHWFVPTIALSSSRPQHHYINLYATNLIDPPNTGTSQMDHHGYFNRTDTIPNTMIIWDSGATYAITPHIEDFIPESYETISSSVRGLTSTTPITGRGTVRWRFKDINGIPATIEVFAHHIPSAEVRLLSPQHYLQCAGGGTYTLTKDASIFTFKDGTQLHIPYHQSNGLPTVYNEPLDHVLVTSPSSHDVCMSVLEETNQNLTGPQKELLLYHARYGHINFNTIQFNMREHKFVDDNNTAVTLGPAFKSRYQRSKSCDPPKCAACLLGKAHKRPVSGRKSQIVPPSPSAPKLEPGELIGCDHYESSLKGRLENTYGKEKENEKYIGGTIFCDVASGLVHTEHQISLRVGDTLRAKNTFEQMASTYGVTIKSYLGDNGIFAAEGFRADIEAKTQTIQFSGVGAHHQNGIAERNIKTVTYLARTMLIHMCLHWPDQSTELDLWPFALTYACWLWNRIPSPSSGLSPLEIFSKTKSDHKDLSRARVWGSPAYVLDPKLQDGLKLPKWKSRAQRGQFLGFSPHHSTTVGLLRNLKTGNVSPQYHVVIDEFFYTVPNLDFGLQVENTWFEERWEELLRVHRDFYLHDVLGPDEIQTLPPLDEEWLTPSQARDRRAEIKKRFDQRYRAALDGVPQTQREINTFQPQREPEEPLQLSDDVSLIDNSKDSALSRPSDTTSVSSNESGPPDPASSSSDSGSPDNLSTQLELKDTDTPIDPLDNAPEGVRRSRRQRKPNSRYRNYATLNAYMTECPGPTPYLPRRKCNLGHLNSAFLNTLSWNGFEYDLSQPKSTWNTLLSSINMSRDSQDNTFNNISPLLLATRANMSDNPNWYQAMNGPDADGYWEAMELEINTLIDLAAWKEVRLDRSYNVLDSTWAFKCKRYPDGRVKKLKARFCVRGDQQIEGIDFFETFAPVVQWSTIRLMLVLSQRLGLATAQVDYTAAFVQAKIDEDVYVQMPRGFRKPNTVLKLNRSLYGLRQSPRNFFNHLKENLQSKELGFVQSTHDPCLFFGKTCIVVTYVDDCLFFAKDLNMIDEVIIQLRKQNMSLNKEDDVAGFLGINIIRTSAGDIEMTQTGLIDRIIATLGLENATNKQTPAEVLPLGKDTEGEKAEGLFNYASVVGMLLYLQGNTRPDISFAVNQCARFSANPRKKHECALKRIGRYLRATRDKGLIMKNEDAPSLNCWCDADFAGLWKVEDPQNSASVKSRTGYIFTLGSCPILWASKLQTEIALSTMEAEYIALSTAMREFIPLQRILFEIADRLNLKSIKSSVIKSTIWEDNSGCLTLASLEPPRMTPRSKHYGTKYHWFREKLEELDITLQKVATADQLADIMTKGLPHGPLTHLRKLLMGW